METTKKSKVRRDKSQKKKEGPCETQEKVAHVLHSCTKQRTQRRLQRRQPREQHERSGFHTHKSYTNVHKSKREDSNLRNGSAPPATFTNTREIAAPRTTPFPTPLLANSHKELGVTQFHARRGHFDTPQLHIFDDQKNQLDDQKRHAKTQSGTPMSSQNSLRFTIQGSTTLPFVTRTRSSIKYHTGGTRFPVIPMVDEFFARYFKTFRKKE